MTAQLTANLRLSLPDGALIDTVLPQIPLRLWLLDAAMLADRPLAPETAAKVMAEPAYWAFCWASGQALAARILAEPALVCGRRVLDFGAGSGVVAIAAALAGAAEVWACDTDAHARDAIRANAALNGVTVRILDDLAGAPVVDLLLAADVLYDADNYPLVESFAHRADAVLLADSRVRSLPVSGYQPLGEAQSCTWPDLGEPAQFNGVNFYARGLFGALPDH